MVGSGRGMTHVGIYRAMMEANIPIDIVCGTSIGALIGAQMAIGKSWKQIQQSLIRVFKTLESYQLSFSLSSFISPKTHAKIASTLQPSQEVETWNCSRIAQYEYPNRFVLNE